MDDLNDQNNGEKKDDGSSDDQDVDFDFTYNDTDDYAAEISEFYSYSEEKDILQNKEIFDADFGKKYQSKWIEVDDQIRYNYISNLLDRFDVSSKSERIIAARCALYILQGVFAQCELEEDQLTWARHNVYLCIKAGMLQPAIGLLLSEIDIDDWFFTNGFKFSPIQPQIIRDSKTSLFNETRNLRIILSIIYTLVESVRDGKYGHDSSNQDLKRASLREQFIEELNEPVLNDRKTTLTIILFGMIHRFSIGLAPHFPVKKTLLLLWKVNLVTLIRLSQCIKLTLGPITGLFDRKNEKRKLLGLPPLREDTHAIIKNVQASNPPPLAADHAFNRNTRIVNRQTAGSQEPRRGSLAGGRSAFEATMVQDLNLNQQFLANKVFPIVVPPTPPARHTSSKTLSHIEGESSGFFTPRPSSPSEDSDKDSISKYSIDNEFDNSNSKMLLKGYSLPWRPKVRKRDIQQYLESARRKYVHIKVDPDDILSLSGLPPPVHDAMVVLNAHLYVSIAEVEMKHEMDIARHPLSMGKQPIPDTPIERLYKTIYPLFPHYMIALLKVLLAAAPTSRPRSETIDILDEVVPKDTISGVVESTLLNIDVDRHKEITVKAISALMLLLLKHLKLNHIYQYEYVSQQLVFANCIPLILKFFNQNIVAYVKARNSSPVLDFPSYFIGERVELNLEILSNSNSLQNCSWRNLFSCINLMRILCKISKWKHARTIMLVAFKSAPILKRVLHVRNAMLQLYALKLLKSQSRYFGRQWRKNNMAVMSAIYQKVRHRLTDDWAYGNEVEARPVDFQADECSLRACVDQFNHRRYTNNWIDQDFRPLNNSLAATLNETIELSEEFKCNYYSWLEKEVFSENPIDWDLILTPPKQKQKPSKYSNEVATV